MFEKEAEEWAKESMDCVETDNCLNQSIPYFSEEERCIAKSAFQDGAEFGYSKGNKDKNEARRLLTRWLDDGPYTVSELKDLIADTEQFLKGDV